MSKINVKSILLDKISPINYAAIQHTLKCEDAIITTIKEIVEIVIEECSKNAKTKNITHPSCDDHTPYWGACVSCGRMDNPDIIIGSEVDEQSILKIKEEIEYK